ncbi:MAG: site-specific integrase [Halanaerobiales bacterium]|nr:site-specific integrase [Halanaerobiales bacterium]
MRGGVRKRGKVWYYYFDLGKVEGKRKKIERKGGRTKEEAETALRNAMSEYERCGSINAETDMSVADYFDYWYKEYVLVNCKYNTQEYYKDVIRVHIKPTLGMYKLKALSPAKLQEFLNSKMINGYSKNSVSNFYGVLSGALKKAISPYELLKRNPMENVSMPKYNEKKKNKEDLKIITIEQFQRIIQRFPQGSSFYVFLQICFHTGFRPGEACGFQWKYMDFENKTVEVDGTLKYEDKEWVFGTPKTPSSYRTIKVGDTLIALLKEHKKYQEMNKEKYGRHYIHSDYICTKESGKLVTTDSIKYLSRIVNYELMINFNPHSLRHTHATLLLENEANPKDVQKRLGHSILATTMDTYFHVTEKLKQDSVDKFESIIAGISKLPPTK